MRGYLNQNLLQRWKGYTRKVDDMLMWWLDDVLILWPPWSPDLPPCDFLWRFVKDAVFVPPLPTNLQDHIHLITAAVSVVDRDMLTRTWNKSHICYYCLLEPNYGNYARRLFLKKKNSSLQLRNNYYHPLRSLFLVNVLIVSWTYE